MNLRVVAVIVGLAGLGLFILINAEQFAHAFRLILQVQWGYLLLVPAWQAVSYYAVAQYYRTFLRSFGYDLPIRYLYELALALNFVNAAIPSAGISGLSFFSYGLGKEADVSAGKVTLTQIGRYFLTYASFILILIVGLGFMYFGGSIVRIAVRIVVLLTAAIILLSGLILYAFHDKRAFNALVRWVQSAIDWLSGRFRSGKALIGKDRAERLLNEFHDGYDRLMQQRGKLKEPFIWALTSSVLEVLTLYMVFVALGYFINPGIVILTYAVANISGFISVIPGDIGVYEAVMVAVLGLVGVPLAVGVSATLLYRIITKATFLPIGFYFYNKHLKEAT